jgi:hypothetical protein
VSVLPSRIARLALALACAAIAACGGGGGGGGSNPPAPLNLAAAALDDGIVGSAYDDSVVATGGSGQKTYELTGSLPAGLSLAANGRITGTAGGPPGTAEFTITVTDSASPPATDAQEFSIRIAAPLEVDAGSPPTAVIGDAFSHAIGIAGGTPPYQVTAPLPSGLAVDANGLITGTPAASAVTAVGDLTVTDSASPPQEVAMPLRLPVRLEIRTTALPDGFSGAAYAAGLQARGGLPAYRWEQTGGSLPFAVADDGQVTGTADDSCDVVNHTLDVALEDSDTPLQSAGRTGITLSILPRDVAFLASSAPPVGTLGAAYEHQLVLESGVGPFVFSVASGTLPAGLTLGAATGTLSGTPTTDGTSNFTLQVTDDCGTTATADFSILVRATPAGRNDSIATATPAGNGVMVASISPSGHPNTVFSPDEDFYRVQAGAASDVTVDLDALGGELDTVMEIVDAAGVPLQTCGAPNFNSECVNDDESPDSLDSLLQLRLAGPATFYIHVVEWRGDARPDLRYRMTISGVN